MDFLPASWNYLDTMVDREAASEGPDYPRKAFIDHFYLPSASLAEFAARGLRELGDFVNGTFVLVELNRALPELLMQRDGGLAGPDGPRPVRIEKRFVFRPRSIDVYYRVTNRGTQSLAARFGVEINVSLADRSAESGRLFLLDEDRKKELGTEAGEIDGVQGILVRDVRNEVSVTLSSALPCRFWNVPLETRRLPADGGGSTFQSHCFLPAWDLVIAAGEAWENHLSIGFEKSQTP
jgi:hypothetical protein